MPIEHPLEIIKNIVELHAHEMEYEISDITNANHDVIVIITNSKDENLVSANCSMERLRALLHIQIKVLTDRITYDGYLKKSKKPLRDTQH